MTSIAAITRRVVAVVTAEPPEQALVSVRPYRPPVLSPELKRELDRALAGPLILPGAGEGDARMIVHPDLTWQPDADAAAEQLRAGMSSRAPRETIEQWLATLAMMVANAPTDPVAIEQQCAVMWRACGQLPAAVWCDESIDAWLDAVEDDPSKKFWPKPIELRHFLSARVSLIERQITDLDRIAKAPRQRSGPAREAPPRPIEPAPDYIVNAASRRPALRERGDDDFDPVEAKAIDAEARKSRDAQLAAFGDTGDVDLLAKRLARSAPPQERKP
jgi:hypothetical protein